MTENSINKGKFATRDLVKVGLFTAVIIVLAQIAIPMPSGVPVTLQPLAIALTGIVIGSKLGFFSTLVYILLGAIGLPVFANFTGGLGIIVGPTSGFIFGFLIYVVLCGVGINQKSKVLQFIPGLIGLFLCHLLGVVVFSFITKMGFMKALLLVSAPYIIKDIAFYIAAVVIGTNIRKRIGF